MAVTEQQVWQPYFVFHLDTVSIFHTRLYFESSAWVQKGQTGTFPLGEHLMGEGRGGDEQSKACPPPAPVRAEWPGRMGHPDAELTSPIASQIFPDATTPTAALQPQSHRVRAQLPSTRDTVYSSGSFPRPTSSRS